MFVFLICASFLCICIPQLPGSNSNLHGILVLMTLSLIHDATAFTLMQRMKACCIFYGGVTNMLDIFMTFFVQAVRGGILYGRYKCTKQTRVIILGRTSDNLNRALGLSLSKP